MGTGWLWLVLRILLVVALAITIFLSWHHAPPWANIAFAAFVLALMLLEGRPHAKQSKTERLREGSDR